jgi:hypothetical protein
LQAPKPQPPIKKLIKNHVYKEIEVLFFSNRIGFSYLYIIIKEYNLVTALIIAYNRKKTSNISINKFKWVSS